MQLLTSEEIKEHLFGILSVFADLCDEYGIRYYLCGGTLLGAVRHRDFIPWDDDIDVLVPRPDYERMCSLFRDRVFSDHYRMMSYEYGDLAYPFSKFVDTDMPVGAYYNRLDRYLWIDVFPMDGLPGTEDEDRAHLIKANSIKRRYGLATGRLFSGSTKAKAILGFPAKVLFRLMGSGRYLKQLDETAKTYGFETSEYVAGVAWSLGPGERVRKDSFVPVIDLEFHGRMFHAPAGYDEYLSSLYGDYMTPPPPSERRNHRIDVYRGN